MHFKLTAMFFAFALLAGCDVTPPDGTPPAAPRPQPQPPREQPRPNPAYRTEEPARLFCWHPEPLRQMIAAHRRVDLLAIDFSTSRFADRSFAAGCSGGSLPRAAVPTFYWPQPRTTADGYTVWIEEWINRDTGVKIYTLTPVRPEIYARR